MTQRISEAELQETIDYFAGLPDLEPLHRPDAELVVKMGNEIRRYRALLLGLAGQPGDEPYCCACVFCNNSDPGKHYVGCPWLALEAEVRAIREER